MKHIGHVLDLKLKKTPRLGLLLLSTLIIISASTLAYARVVYEKPLDVGGTNTVNQGPGSTAPSGTSPGSATILILGVLALVVSISIFVFARELSRHKRSTPNGQPSPPTSPMPEPPKEEESEYPATNETGEGTYDEIIKAILGPGHEESATKAYAPEERPAS